jgi:hypothetical protein
MRPVVLACAQHAPSSAGMQELAYNSEPVALLSSCVRGGNSAREGSAIPASLASFLHEFLGERAVARETVKKAAPVFRAYDGSF